MAVSLPYPSIGMSLSSALWSAFTQYAHSGDGEDLYKQSSLEFVLEVDMDRGVMCVWHEDRDMTRINEPTNISGIVYFTISLGSKGDTALLLPTVH